MSTPNPADLGELVARVSTFLDARKFHMDESCPEFPIGNVRKLFAALVAQQREIEDLHARWETEFCRAEALEKERDAERERADECSGESSLLREELDGTRQFLAVAEAEVADLKAKLDRAAEALGDACDEIAELRHFANNNGGMYDTEEFELGRNIIDELTQEGGK